MIGPQSTLNYNFPTEGSSQDATFNETALQIIEGALEIVGVYGEGVTLTDYQYQQGLRALNRMIRSWENLGIGVWVRTRATVFQKIGAQFYDLGLSPNCHATTSYSQTTLSQGASENDTQIYVESGFSCKEGDWVGIVLDDKSLDWHKAEDNVDLNHRIRFTIADRDSICESQLPAGGDLTMNGTLVSDGVAYLTEPQKITAYSKGDESGNAVHITGTYEGELRTEHIVCGNGTTVTGDLLFDTVTNVLIELAASDLMEVGTAGGKLAGDASAGNTVFRYTEDLTKPLDISNAWYEQYTGTRYPLNIAQDREDALSISLPTQTGSYPNQVYYQAFKNHGRLYVWPVCNDARNTILLDCRLPIQNFTSQSEYPDLPPQWLEALEFNLAVRLAPRYERVLQRSTIDMAEQLLREARGADRQTKGFRIRYLRQR